MKRIILIFTFILFGWEASLAQSATPGHIQVISDFDNNLAIALDTKTNKKGMITKQGSIVAKPIYDDIDRFKNGFFKTTISRRKKRVGLVDTNGKTIVKPKKFSTIWLAKKPNGAYKFQLTKESSEKVFYLAENGKIEVDWSY